MPGCLSFRRLKGGVTISNNMVALKFMLRALRYRNYRLFFGGQGISLVGTWMQQVAASWLVYRLTNSAFLLGLVGFIGQVPAFFSTPFSGVLADRWDRRRILTITQTLSMMQAFVLTFLVMTGVVRVWHIMVLSGFLGLINSLDIPARHAFIFELVEKKEDLSNAIALNSSIFNAARLIGPSLSGILISIIGEGMCFFINGVSFLAVILALLLMKIKPKEHTIQSGSLIGGIKEGFIYAFGFVPIRAILLLLILVSLMGISYVVLMPIIVTKVLYGGPQMLGFLMTAAGLGALIAAIYLALRKTILGLEKTIAVSCAVFGLALVFFSLSCSFWFSLVILVFIGFGMMAQAAASNTVLQAIADDDKRGRLMSLYVMSFMGIVPFGSLLAGSLASRIGAQNTLMIGGIFCILGSVVFASKLTSLRSLLYPIYEKKA